MQRPLRQTRTRKPTIISRLSTILENNNLPLYLSKLLQKLQQHYHYLLEKIKDLEAQLKKKLNEDEVGQRLLTIPCVGTLTASTISTEFGDGKHCAAVISQRQRDWFHVSTAPVVEQRCWGAANEATKRSEHCWSSAREFSYKNWNTRKANWRTGSGDYCAEKATLL